MFKDRIFWALVGEEPDPFRELAKWARALGADLRSGKDLDDAMARVRALLDDKRGCSSSWTTCGTRTPGSRFGSAGPSAGTIVTTRFGDVGGALAVTPQDVIVLDRLSDDDGVGLLWQLTPTVVDRHPDASRRLVADLEGLPLALRVAGRLLEREAAAGFDVDEVFETLGSSAAILSERRARRPVDPRTATTPTIELLMRKSTDRLEPETRRHFAFLGGMAPKPATFSLQAMQAVASASGVAGLLKNGAEGANRIVCVLTGHGAKDPQVALGHAGSVVPCEPDIAAVERAVLGS